MDDYELIAQKVSGIDEKVSRLEIHMSDILTRMTDIEKVNAELEEAALNTARRALNGVAEPQHRTHLPPNLSLREGSSRTERGTPPPAVANLTSGHSGGKVPSVQIGASGTPTEVGEVC